MRLLQTYLKLNYMLKLPIAKRAKSGRAEAGQALLIVLLTMSVILSVVLSAVSRSVTEVSVTSYEENATRAFSAAEAGVEQALLTGAGSGGLQELDSSTKYNTTVSTPSGAREFRYPADLISGQSATFWFVSHNDTGALTCGLGKPCLQADRINICWGVPNTPAGNPNAPAIEVSVFYDTNLIKAVSNGNFSGVKVARRPYDPNSVRRNSNNFFNITTGCKIAGTSYPYEFSTGDITFTGIPPVVMPISCWNTAGCLLAAKVRMFYNDSSSPQPLFIRVTPTSGTSLPAQGTQIDSTGTAGESTRKVNVFQSYPEAPFDVAVSSLKDLVK